MEHRYIWVESCLTSPYVVSIAQGKPRYDAYSQVQGESVAKHYITFVLTSPVRLTSCVNFLILL
jgi:hypothetical protein